MNIATLTKAEEETINSIDLDKLWRAYRIFAKRASNITDMNSEVVTDFLSWLEREKEPFELREI